MEKMKMHTPNIADENFRKLAELFPNAVTESIDKNGEVVRAIDKDVLMQEINTKVVEGREERYQFTWPDKKKSILLANAPINKTLRPCREESVGKDGTNGGFDSENLYIEGDNLEVLKLLQETYLGKIKMIYIDPPYNTGNDFIYNDKFKMNSEEWNEVSGYYDDDGNRLVKNLETNGSFHTDWLNMMYPRLKLAKDLLKDDGVIFISIDDNEVENLKKICNEIFGQDRFLAQCVRKRRDSQANLSKNISPIHEYILMYSKCNGEVLNKVKAIIDESIYKNPDCDERGPYVTMPCTNKGGTVYTVITPTGKEITDEWRFKKETYDKLLAENRLVYPKNGEGKPRYKLFLSEKKKQGVLPNTWLDDMSSNQEATREIKKFFGELLFDTPKPVELLKFCCELATDKNSVILDFFSGSATTAHAVMQLNAEDNGNRKFIMVQIQEKTNEKSEAYKQGYKNICEIGKERIRRAGKKIRDGEQLSIENCQIHTPNSTLSTDLDIGFRVLKCDSSNMKDVYYNPDEFDELTIDSSIDNIKEDRTPEDLLFQVMLDLGVLLSSKIEEKIIDEKKVFDVAEGFLVACFDDNITNETITEIAKQQPYYFVMRDSSIANDSVATNFEQIFNTYSKGTIRKII